MSLPFTEERKDLPCGCKTSRIVDVFPFFRFTKYCEAHAKEHRTDVNCETHLIDNSPKFVETDADVERVANYLKKGHVADTFQISHDLRMKGVIVALSLQKLMDKNLVGSTIDKPHKYFFNP
jgi:hypothetical protein